MKRSSFIYLLCAGVSGLGMSAQTAATEAASQPQYESYDGETIVVQARRRDEDIQDVPAVINAVTAQAISDLNMRDFTDVKALAPGLELSPAFNGIGGNARLRGINFDNNASGNNGTIEFYFNDAPISAGILFQPMYDVGQIEVQRGPQGTLRGRAAPSGSITVTSRKPDLYGFGGDLDLTANNIGTMNFKGAVNIPVIEGVAGLRVSGLWEESNATHVKPLGNGPDPYSRTKSYRVTGVVNPTDWLKLEATYQMLDRRANVYDQAISFSEVNPNATQSAVLLRAKDRRSLVDYSHLIGQRYEIANWRSEVAFAGQRLIYQGQWTNQEITSTEYNDPAHLFAGTNIQQNTFSNPRATSHEIRLQNDERLFNIFDYVVGFFDNKADLPTDLSRPTIVAAPTQGGGLSLASIAKTDMTRAGRSHERSIFGNLTARIGQATEVSGGLRHIQYKDSNELLIGTNLLSANRQKLNKWIYNASIKHNITDDHLVYVATGSSMRPGINVIGDFNIVKSALEKSFLDLQPETSKSYELGFKNSFWNKRAQFNLTFYHQKFENFPYRIPGDGIFFVNTVAVRNGVGQVTGTAEQVSSFNFVGAVPVEVNGVEGDLFVDVNRNWNIGLSGSYSLGKIKNGLIPCNDLNGDGVPDVVTTAPSLTDLKTAVGANNLSGCKVTQRSAFLPPLTLTFQSEYKFSLSNQSDSYLRTLVNYSGKSQGNPSNVFDDVGAYALFNVYAGVRAHDKTWDISIFAKNLFNTTKLTSLSNPLFTSYQLVTGATTTSAQTFTSNYVGATVTPPREFGLNFRYSFGSR